MFFSNGTTRNERRPAQLLALIAVLALAMLFSMSRISGAAAAAPHASGDLDPTFGTGGKVATEFGSTLDQVNAMVIQPDGKIVAAGEAWPGEPGRAHFALARYNANGTLDTTFGTGGQALIQLIDTPNDSSQAFVVALQADGKIVAAGMAYNPAQYHETFALARLNADGSLDSSFGTDGRVLTAIDPTTGYGHSDEIHAITIAADSKIVVAGNTAGYPKPFAVARYNADGTLDTSFGATGFVTTDMNGDSQANGVAIQPDGKIVVVGRGNPGGNDFVLARYLSNGALDTGFGTAGRVSTDFLGGQDWGNAVALRPDGKIIVGGVGELPCQWTCQKWGFALAQYNADGSLDTSFGDAGLSHYDFISSAGAYAMARRADGKIVLAGHIGSDDFAVALYNADGSLDASFGDSGLARTDFAGDTDRAYAIAFQADGKIVAAGRATVDPSNHLNSDFGLARYQVGGGAPPPPTSTPPPATTPTPPPDGCQTPYSDVPVDNPFYMYVHCLACRAILSGYSDGTFRPGANVTRGQLSKIVANAAGFNDPVSGQSFTDVPATSPFYPFVERMVMHGVISGYSDGTFRPGTNATRGQIAKIVANAAGFNDDVTGQSFTDVPPASPFYPFVERAVLHGAISGYSDGTFRPGNDATRGQTAKIVSNSFFPNCSSLDVARK